jgi:hypothetical protein
MFLKIVSFSLFICFAFTQMSAQNNYRNNSIHVSYGNLIFVSQANISYERTLVQKNIFSTRARIGYGNYLSNNFDFDTNAKVHENYLSLGIVQLIGPLEVSVGTAYTSFTFSPGFDPDPSVNYEERFNGFEIIGNIGLRYTTNKWLFRGGIGNHEKIYFGVGLNF